MSKTSTYPSVVNRSRGLKKEHVRDSLGGVVRLPFKKTDIAHVDKEDNTGSMPSPTPGGGGGLLVSQKSHLFV